MCDSHVPQPRRFSRRRALLAFAAGAGALAMGDAFGGAGVASAEPIGDAGTALAKAKRLRMAPRPIEPPPEGKLIFPMEVPAKSNIYILDNFGDCRDHEGIDIMAAKGGNPIFAVADGELRKWYTNTGTAGWGWTLFDPVTEVTYKYFHMAEDQNGWAVGDHVELGDVIGFVGNSGTYGVDNFHLHFEVRPGNVPVNPLPLIHIPTDLPIGRRNPSC